MKKILFIIVLLCLAGCATIHEKISRKEAKELPVGWWAGGLEPIIIEEVK